MEILQNIAEAGKSRRKSVSQAYAYNPGLFMEVSVAPPPDPLRTPSGTPSGPLLGPPPDPFWDPLPSKEPVCCTRRILGVHNVGNTRVLDVRAPRV
eukprot:2680712-Pyramimonas_sp.AAC.1